MCAALLSAISAGPSCNWRDDCTQATKRQAPRRTVMITADCVPCLFRQMGARHGNGPGRRIRRGRSGPYHCSSGPRWPVMTRADRGGPDRALSASRMVSCTRPELGFCWWQVLGSNQRRLSRRFYRPLDPTSHMPPDLQFCSRYRPSHPVLSAICPCIRQGGCVKPRTGTDSVRACPATSTFT